MSLLDFFSGDDAVPSGYMAWGGEASPEEISPGFDWDFGGGDAVQPDYGSFAAYTPDFFSYSPEEQMPMGLSWDTTSGQAVLPGGQPFDPTAGGGGEPLGPPSPTADQRFGQRVEEEATRRFERDRFTRAVQERLGQQQGGGGWLASAGRFLEGPLGRALGVLGVGGLGLAATRALAGPAPQYKSPTYTEAPETTALRGAAFPGQLAIAGQLAARAEREGLAEQEQAPAERLMRLMALQNMGGFLPGGPADPIVAGLRAEAMRAMDPAYQDPLVEEALTEEQNRLANAQVRQYGGLAAAQSSTPGVDVLLQAARQRGLARSQARQSAIRAYAPAAISAEQGIQGIRRQNLGDVERLSRFGLAGVPETATGLMTLAGNPEMARMTNLSLAQQQAMEGYRGQQAERTGLATSIGGIAGQVAGTIGQRPNPWEQFLRDYQGA